MKSLKASLWKYVAALSLLLVIAVFFYFESSFALRFMVVFLGLIGLFSFKQTPEILTLFVLYLGLYDLYNIRYGLAVPLSLILIAVFSLAVFVFFIWTKFAKFSALNKDIFLLYLIIAGLAVMEIFLTMSFWPVDPKIKSLVIVTAFGILIKVFYLYVNNVLNLKKTAIFILISLLVLGGVLLFNMLYSY